MSTFESSVKIVEYPQEKVYATLSDLSNLGKLEGRFPEDTFQDFEFSADSVSISVQPVGKVAMNIVDREEPKCIKYETIQSPVPFNLWVQLLPVTETTCKMKLTIKADLNPFVKVMISKPLNEGLEKLADTLAQVRYE
ncbi:MAG: SRPBCC family protein [Prevotella sp.]|nr:SRPBCC family protein [Prevotella sp.]